MALDIAPCGTVAAYRRHRRRGEPYCDPCRAANTASLKEWYNKNKEHARTKRNALGYTSSPKFKIYAKQWYKDNKEEVLAKQKEYSENNKEQRNRQASRRRAKVRNSKVETYSTQQVLDTYGINCHICNEQIDLEAPRSTRKAGWQRGLHVDHVIPIAKGGTDTLDNVRPAHGICNLSKGVTIKDVENA